MMNKSWFVVDVIYPAHNKFYILTITSGINKFICEVTPETPILKGDMIHCPVDGNCFLNNKENSKTTIISMVKYSTVHWRILKNILQEK
ncbi:hypothetical protein ML057_004683 [Klebsiella pneumoniae]|nr:hypothetical protein [Klebsiella pneumoniae]